MVCTVHPQSQFRFLFLNGKYRLLPPACTELFPLMQAQNVRASWLLSMFKSNFFAQMQAMQGDTVSFVASSLMPVRCVTVLRSCGNTLKKVGILFQSVQCFIQSFNFVIMMRCHKAGKYEHFCTIISRLPQKHDNCKTLEQIPLTAMYICNA